jgi:hypothetical protein
LWVVFVNQLCFSSTTMITFEPIARVVLGESRVRRSCLPMKKMGGPSDGWTILYTVYSLMARTTENHGVYLICAHPIWRRGKNDMEVSAQPTYTVKY